MIKLILGMLHMALLLLRTQAMAIMAIFPALPTEETGIILRAALLTSAVASLGEASQSRFPTPTEFKKLSKHDFGFAGYYSAIYVLVLVLVLTLASDPCHHSWSLCPAKSACLLCDT